MMGRMMGRKAKELTALAVKNLASPGLHFVGGVDGLALQVSPSGARSWILRKMISGKRRDMGLGGFPDVPLAQAREKTRQIREQVDQGMDPIEDRRAKQAALAAERSKRVTFAQCVDAYLDAHGDSWKNSKHRQQWQNTLETYAGPIIGNLDVATVDTGLVLKVEHHAALPYRELGAFMADLEKMEGMGARALEFAILCASRSGEVRGATWDEIDLTEGVWTIPGDRMKAGKEHRVPLSTKALDILKALPRMVGTDLVFPGVRNDKPLSDMSLTAVLRRMGRGDLTAHGFRSTFRDWAAEQTAYPSEVVEMALAHTIGNKVEAAYRRGDLFEKRRRLMDEWAKYCGRPLEQTDNVVVLKSVGLA
jgi:integrase